MIQYTVRPCWDALFEDNYINSLHIDTSIGAGRWNSKKLNIYSKAYSCEPIASCDLTKHNYLDSLIGYLRYHSMDGIHKSEGDINVDNNTVKMESTNIIVNCIYTQETKHVIASKSLCKVY